MGLCVKTKKKKKIHDLLKNFNFLFDSTTPQAEPDPRKLCLYFVRLFLLYRVISLSLLLDPDTKLTWVAKSYL